jgi:DNA-binding transcriptional LysR family regulator
MPQPDLDDLRAFVAIANRRSFRKAADELGVSPSTLSHMMRVMEEKLGVRLLNRTTRSVAPTEAGEVFLRRLEPVLRELGAACEAVNGIGQQPGGLLRINTAEPTAHWLLQHAVPVFQARYPAVALDLFVDNGLVDIVAGGFDAGVRLAEAVPQDMHLARFGAPVRFMPMASPAYLKEHGVPFVPDDLLGHRCIRMRMQSGKIYRWEFTRHGQAMALDVPGTLILNQVGHRLRAGHQCARPSGRRPPGALAARLVCTVERAGLVLSWPPACTFRAARLHRGAAGSISARSGPKTGRQTPNWR